MLVVGGAVQGDVFHQPGVDGVQHHNFLFQGQGRVLALLEHLGGELPSGQLGAGCGVEVGGAELGEGRQLAVLGQFQPQPPGNFADGPRLGRAAHPRDRKPHVDRRADAGVEKLRLKVNLPVGDGNHVGRDVGGNVAGLRLNDGQRGDGAAAVGLIEAGGTLQQAAVQVENVSGVGFAPGGPSQQQRHLAVGPSVFGQIVVHDQHVLALRHVLFGHGAASIGGQVLQGRGVGSAGGDYDRVAHRVGLFQRADDLGDLALFLADGHVDADEVAAPLVDDGIDGDGGLAGGAVADDQLPLAPPDGNHGVDGLDSGLHRGVHRLAHHHVGSNRFGGTAAGGGYRPLAVQRPAQGVDHAADEGVADRDFDDPASGAHPVAFFDGVGVAQDGRAD